MRSPLPPGEVMCVAVTGSSAEELLRHSDALLPSFRFQELRLDYLEHPFAALPTLRAHIAQRSQVSFLATCRRRESGGRFSGTVAEEVAVLLEAARCGCRLVDLSLESAESSPREAVAQLRAAGAAVVLSWHDFEQTPDLSAVHGRMLRFAPDLCKIVPTATRLSDTLPLFDLLRRGSHEPAPKIVALAMGEAGVPSRVLGLRAGSAFTFAAATPADATAPGQLPAEVLRDLYRVASLDGDTRVYGVAGNPVRSSLSPLMLNTAFAQAGVNSVYMPLLTHEAAELFHVAQALPLAGFSVTMPLKQAVVPLLAHVDPLAAEIGAVNTVRREADGSFSGFNTDAAGITAPLGARLDLRGARVLVLGAGGAARAAVFACAARGAEVSILNRTHAGAESLAKESGAVALRREDLRAVPVFDALINATPAGMRGNPAELPLHPDELHTRLVFDLVYNPLETPLLRAARERGLETIAGLEMFVHQGARQFELWTGSSAPVDAMRSAVVAALSDTQNR